MGCCQTFRCPSCDYTARVAGGADMGMSCYTQTIHCKTCQEIGDVVTQQFEPGEGPGRDPDPTEVPPCPDGESHEVVTWSAGDPCPKCGAALEASEDFVLWD